MTQKLEEARKLYRTANADQRYVLESLFPELAESEVKMAEEIIINLKRVEQDYHIDLTREMEWVRNKVKKGK